MIRVLAGVAEVVVLLAGVTAAKRLAQEALVFPPHPAPTASPEPGHVPQELFG